MIERLYGWGSGCVAMPRAKKDRGKGAPVRTGLGADLRRHLAADVPWRAAAASVCASVSGLLLLSSLHSQLPDLTRETASVAVTVRFLEPPAEPAPPPPPEPQAPVVRQIEAPPPKPAPVASAPARVLAEPAPAAPSAQPVATAPKTAPPKADTTVELGPPPEVSPPPLRERRDDLPALTAAPFSAPGGRDLLLSDSGLSRPLRPERREGAALPEPVRGGMPAPQERAHIGALPEAKIAPLREDAAQREHLPEARGALVRPAASTETIALSPAPHPAPRTTQQGAPAVEAGRPVFELVDRDNPPVLDPSRLMSLSELRTCVNPQAENDLRARLATLLSRPTICRSEGVFFDVRHPESAWSIRVDIYNYEGALFSDRCAALRRAVECSENARRTPL